MASGSKKVIIAALVGNALVAITKFVAATITGSAAMFSEGVHSVVDTGNQVLLLFGLKQASKPADERFPFGHGKEIYFWCFVVSILIFALGAGISIYEGVHSLMHPEAVKSPMVNYIVLGLAIAFEGAAWYMAFSEFNKVKGEQGYIQAVNDGKDPSMFVVLFEDSAAMAGLLIALLGVFLSDITGILYFDGLASVLIGVILAATALWLAIETKSLLIGESASPEKIEQIRRIVSNEPGVDHVNEVLTMHMGPDFILANISIDFVDDATADTVESSIADMNKQIKQALPRVKRVFIEVQNRGL